MLPRLACKNDLPDSCVGWETFGVIEDQASKRRKDSAAVGTLGTQYAALATENADAGLWVWETEPNQVWMNPYCCHLVGANDNWVAFDTFLNFIAGTRQECLRKLMRDAAADMGAFQGEFESRQTGREPHWLLAKGQGLSTGSGRALTGILLDITELKTLQQEAERLRQQVIHLTRVSTLGELSGAVAHELNQPLTAILSNAQAGQRLISRNAASSDEIRCILEDIIEDDRRAGAVLTRLRNLIRNEQVDFSEIDLNDVVAEVLHLVHSELIERRVEVVIESTPGLPLVRGDRIQIQQVLINLVRNACDAMAAVRGAEHRLVVKTGRRCNESVIIAVTDNGTGLSPALRDSLFEPFVTTKRNGMGLGLTISRAIIAGHRGDIWFEDNPGGGSIFGFSLPAMKGRDAWMGHGT